MSGCNRGGRNYRLNWKRYTNAGDAFWSIGSWEVRPIGWGLGETRWIVWHTPKGGERHVVQRRYGTNSGDKRFKTAEAAMRWVERFEARRHARARRPLLGAVLGVILLALPACAPTPARVTAPVRVDDAPACTDALARSAAAQRTAERALDACESRAAAATPWDPEPESVGEPFTPGWAVVAREAGAP